MNVRLLFVLALVTLLAGIQSVNAQAVSQCLSLTRDMTTGATDATTGGEVTKLQNFLIGKGLLVVQNSTDLGTFGERTAAAVVKFQKNNGILGTGTVGPITRANIQTLTCAIGAVDTSNLPSTVISSSSLPLLTFIAPTAGALVIKGEKDLALAWTLSSGVIATFPTKDTVIDLRLINSSGAEIGTLSKRGIQLKDAAKPHVEKDFEKTLRGKRDNIIPNGQYRIKATLRYATTSNSTRAQALVTQAARYASESGWFTVVDPAPKANISFTTPLLALPHTQSVVLTWSASPTSTSNCKFTNVGTGISENVSRMGTKTVTPVSATSTYRITCDLTSTWPIPGMTYTTTSQKNLVVTIANSNSATGGVQSTTTSNPAPTTGPTSNPASTTNAIVLPPTITATANGTQIFHGGRIQAPGGSVRIVWSTTHNPVCKLNGSTTSPSGDTTFYDLTAASYTFRCTNSAGASTLSFSIEVPVVAASSTVSGNLPRLTITVNGKSIKKGGKAIIPSGTANVSWGAIGADEDKCYLDDTQVSPSGENTFTGLTESSYTFRCSNAVGTSELPFKIKVTNKTTEATAAVKPTITIKANGVEVHEGSEVYAATGTVEARWGSTGANQCFLNGSPFEKTGSRTYYNLSTADYTYACSNSAGTTSINYRLVVPAVLGVSKSCTSLVYNLHRGHESGNVTKLQTFLQSINLLDEVTGFYGDKTISAVKSYQESKGLPMTGMVYNFTRAAIAEDTCR